jgi:hypothetical protein
VGAIALAVVLQVLVVNVPFLNVAFGMVPMNAESWVACAALASSVLWVEEARKLVVRRRARD